MSLNFVMFGHEKTSAKFVRWEQSDKAGHCSITETKLPDYEQDIRNSKEVIARDVFSCFKDNMRTIVDAGKAFGFILNHDYAHAVTTKIDWQPFSMRCKVQKFDNDITNGITQPTYAVSSAKECFQKGLFIIHHIFNSVGQTLIFL